MNHHYDDIRSRIAEAPTWFDECAVPRYGPFAPEKTANLYASECVLLRIACQNCAHDFDVCMSCGPMDHIKQRPTLAARILDGTIHYGDPPNVGCCPPGPTMNCNDLRVLEYWHQPRGVLHGWERDPAREIVLPDGVAPDASDW